MTFLVSGVLGTLYFCLDNDNLLFWSREKGGSSEPNELPLDPPLTDDFVGVSDSKESLQKLIDAVYSYCSKWRLRANVIKSAVMVFSKDAVNGCWKWGEYSLPKVSSYSYLGIDFSSNGAWDMHINKLLDNGRKKVNQLHKVVSNRNVNLSARRLLLLSVIIIFIFILL